MVHVLDFNRLRIPNLKLQNQFWYKEDLCIKISIAVWVSKRKKLTHFRTYNTSQDKNVDGILS